MNLSPMRYKSFIWPNNPETYRISFTRRMAASSTPFGPEYVRGLSIAHRVMSGQGAFYGPDAYDTFKALGSLFYDNTPGQLVHPVWQPARAWFVELSLTQEPQAGFVSYSFAFWEDKGLYKPALSAVATLADSVVPATQAASGSGGTAEAVYHTVVKGDTLSAIARKYGTTLAAIIALNPQIKNPNLIYPGDRVRVK